MCWPEDYLDAHDRHWEDAELLFQEGRLANADHLYGLSAECGLKAIWPGREVERVHLDRGLWERFVEEYNAGNRPIPLTLPVENPFREWRISHRYAARRCFTQEYVEEHRRAAEQVLLFVREYRQGGLV